ncbi:MAG: hypothetical protein WCF18_19870 [Chthoniobacteraceae bacterium]
MKNNLILTTARLAIAACFFSAASAFAGPGLQPMYVPVKASEVASIKPGTRLAVTCGKCHAVLAMTADASKSYEKGFNCPGCKAKFVRKEIGGRGATVGTYVYVDKAGEEATLLRAM